MKQTNSPSPPQLLGYLGLLPFIVPSIFLLYDQTHSIIWHHLLMTYAAIILSFVAAMHWAFAMTLNSLSEKNSRWAYVWSVIVSLVAWAALSMPAWYAPLVLAMMFTLHLWQDIKLCCMTGLPNWYLPLRKKLSLVATVCLLFSTLV